MAAAPASFKAALDAERVSEDLAALADDAAALVRKFDIAAGARQGVHELAPRALSDRGYVVVEWDLESEANGERHYVEFENRIGPGGQPDRWRTDRSMHSRQISTAGIAFAGLSQSRSDGDFRVDPTVFLAVSEEWRATGRNPSTLGLDDVYAFVVMSRLRNGDGTVRLLLPMGLTKTPAGYGYDKDLEEHLYTEDDLEYNDDTGYVTNHKTRGKSGLAPALFAEARLKYPEASIATRFAHRTNRRLRSNKVLLSFVRKFSGCVSVGFAEYLSDRARGPATYKESLLPEFKDWAKKRVAKRDVASPPDPEDRKALEEAGVVESTVKVDSVLHTATVHDFFVRHTDAIMPLSRLVHIPDLVSSLGVFITIAPESHCRPP